MGIDEICGLSAEQLAALTDEQLLAYFKPFLDVTRPERIKREKQKEIKLIQIQLSPAKQAALKALQESGVDMDFLKARRKR
jgi:predicted nucleotide-binding protein (sugar kinase/HSP70/actin superfamily)